MMKIIISLCLLLSAGSAGALDFNGDFVSEFRSALAETPPPAAGPAAPTLPEWTVMVFINGKNDLANFGQADLVEMECYGSTRNMKVVVELGLFKKGVRRYFVRGNGNSSGPGSELLADLGSPDMGDWRHLAEFGKWAKAAYPAKRYMLVVWNHGSGWVSNKGAAQNKGISYDDETRNHISTPELAQAMKEIGKVDILAMDACLMQMAEVAYEVRDYAGHILASEETAPGQGLPYDLALAAVDDLAARPAAEIGSAIVRDYIRGYSRPGKEQKATLSLLNAAALPRLAELSDAWAGAALAYPDKQKLRDAANGAAAYTIDEYKDLCDLAERVADATADPALAEKGEALCAFIRGALVEANGATSRMGSGSNGISVYVSRDGASERYRALDFAKATRWDDFLAALPRYYPPPPPPNPFDPLDPLDPENWRSGGAPLR